MLANVLNSERAVRVSVQVVRAFIRLRETMAAHADLARKLAEMEKGYDAQFKMVFEAIRQLMAQPDPLKKKSGFMAKESQGAYGMEKSRKAEKDQSPQGRGARCLR